MRNKKVKIKLAIIITLIILLSAFLIYEIADTVINYVNLVKTSEKSLNEVKEVITKDGEHVILFASPYCPHCTDFKPVLKEIAEENNFEYLIVDVYNMLDSDLNEISESLNISIQGIPYLIVVKDKKVLNFQEGNQSKEDTIEMLKKSGVIKEVEYE